MGVCSIESEQPAVTTIESVCFSRFVRDCFINNPFFFFYGFGLCNLPENRDQNTPDVFPFIMPVRKIFMNAEHMQ